MRKLLTSSFNNYTSVRNKENRLGNCQLVFIYYIELKTELRYSTFTSCANFKAQETSNLAYSQVIIFKAFLSNSFL